MLWYDTCLWISTLQTSIIHKFIFTFYSHLYINKACLHFVHGVHCMSCRHAPNHYSRKNTPKSKIQKNGSAQKKAHTHAAN